VKGQNLLTAGEDVVRGWINKNLNPQVIALIQKSPAVKAKVLGQEQAVTEALTDYIPGTAGNKMKKAIAKGEGFAGDPTVVALTNYIWLNVSVLQQNAKPAKGAPKRSFMPQTDDSPSWDATLKSGDIDFFPPYAKAAEE